MNSLFFQQKLKYIDRSSRLDFFNSMIKDKRALHYGCADWPIFDINTNLHYKLITSNPSVVGYDIDKDTIQLMQNLDVFKNCHLVYDYNNMRSYSFDLIIAPETIEHVFDVESFIIELSSIGKQILVTAPNALCEHHFYRNNDDGQYFTEIVHPDHKYWFSLYTLQNSIRLVLDKHNKKYTVDEIGFLENRTMVYCLYTIL